MTEDEQLAEIEARAEALRDGPRVFHDREELRRYQEAHDRAAADTAALLAEVRRLERLLMWHHETGNQERLVGLLAGDRCPVCADAPEERA